MGGQIKTKKVFNGKGVVLCLAIKEQSYCLTALSIHLHAYIHKRISF